MTTDPLPAPLPVSGGAWIREPDGALRPEAEANPAAAVSARTPRGRKPAVEGGVQAPVKEA